MVGQNATTQQPVTAPWLPTAKGTATSQLHRHLLRSLGPCELDDLRIALEPVPSDVDAPCEVRQVRRQLLVEIGQGDARALVGSYHQGTRQLQGHSRHGSHEKIWESASLEHLD